METKVCKIHGIMSKTSKYFIIREKRQPKCRQCYNHCIRESRLQLSNNYLKLQTLNQLKNYVKDSVSFEDITEDMLELKKMSILNNRSYKYGEENLKFKTLIDYCRHLSKIYGINVETIKTRIRKGNDIKNSITKNRLFYPRKKYLVNKQYFSSYPEIAKYYNINYCTLKNQLYKHNSIENAILYIKQNLENEKTMLKRGKKSLIK